MRQPIDTAPRDGKDICVEDATGAFDVAHWSSETDKWVWKNGNPINITPTHWYPITRHVYLEDAQSSSPLQGGRAGRKFTASWIAVPLIAAALIGVYFHQEVSETVLVEAGRAVGLNLKPETASASQTLGQLETTAVHMHDT